MPPQIPPRPGYDYKKDMASTRGNFGNYILKPGVDAEVRKPSWKGTETVFRPFPSLSYDDPAQFLPYHMDPEGADETGHWIRRYDCAWGVGNPSTTFLLRDPNLGGMFDPWLTPLGILYRAIEGACKKGQGQPEWYILRENSQGKGKALKAPSETFLMQGVLMVYDSKPLYTGGKVPPGWGNNPSLILSLSSGIGDKFFKLSNTEVENYSGSKFDFENRFVMGDVVNPAGGKYIHLFEKGNDPRVRYSANPSARGQNVATPFTANFNSRPSGGHDSSEEELKGFDMFVTPDLNGLPAALQIPEGVEHAKTKWKYWENILNFPTEIEQAHLLCRVFPASAILYAFSGINQDWISDDVKKAAVNAVSVGMPGSQQGVTGFAGQPGFQGPPSGGHMQQPGHGAPGWGGGQPVPAHLGSNQQMPAMPSMQPALQHPVLPDQLPPVDGGGMDSVFGQPGVDQSVPQGGIPEGPSEGQPMGFDVPPFGGVAPAPAMVPPVQRAPQQVMRPPVQQALQAPAQQVMRAPSPLPPPPQQQHPAAAAAAAAPVQSQQARTVQSTAQLAAARAAAARQAAQQPK